MIPYWHPDSIRPPFGPDWLEFHVFGILVGIGVVLGSWIAQKRAEEVGLNGRVAADLGLWVVIVSFVMAHQVSLFAYFPDRVFGALCTTNVDCFIDGEQFTCGDGRCDNGSWLHVLQIWNGISSFGGFLGAFVAFATFPRFAKIVIIPGVLELAGGKGRPMMKYLDCIALGFVIGWLFGRLGCFTAHDHVGIVTDAPIAVLFPNGWRPGVPDVAGYGPPGFTPRFDLGLMEVLYCVPVAALMFGWARRRTDLRPGWFACAMIFPYVPYRFYLDTLRATDISGKDARYFTDALPPGLTPGQIGALALGVLGVALWVRGGRLRRVPGYAEWVDGDVPAFEDATAARDRLLGTSA